MIVPETVKSLQQSAAEDEKAKSAAETTQLRQDLEDERERVAAMTDRIRKLEADLDDVPLIR